MIIAGVVVAVVSVFIGIGAIASSCSQNNRDRSIASLKVASPTASASASPAVQRAELVSTPSPNPSPTTIPESSYIPDPNDEQSLIAFNWLQDQFGRPHTDSVTYSAKDDCYHWIGPKSHKPMKMKRKEFDTEIWYPYYKANR